ncbi:Mce family protein [Gordonia araii NBRC 100433]|uniref:Mce family protein n=1 Tax=Gordonia araii NBRC 100433 TaxID=1073574 RepID=G7GY04_9ACTN|nr:MlaD family protein [Gordonia araii]GAB08479.1 Mce family protein [Gordonia araii NBRC 100433]
MSRGAAWARRAVLALIVVALATGCGLRAPGAPQGSTYRLSIEFANVLNIPAGAKVLVNGMSVGQLRAVALGRRTATVEVEVSDTQRLPVATRAELRQMTLLGDLYIALVPPADGGDGRLLRDGDRIPVAQTEPPANVETTMLGLSQFINGGLIGRSQDLVRKANDVLPSDPAELRRLSGQAMTQLSEVGAATRSLDTLIVNGAAMAQSLADHRVTIDRTLTIGPARFAAMQEVFLAMVELIADLRVLTKPGGDLLVEPTYSDLKRMLAQADPMLMQIARADTSIQENLVAVRDLLARKIAPFLMSGGEVDITRIDDTKGRATQVADVLRAIGVV